MSLVLVLGGARSGKSAYAQAAAETAPRTGRLVMIATAEAHDAEMAERIARHRADRDERWTTMDAPRDLTDAVTALRAGDVAVVDCLTLWLSNLMMLERDLPAAAAELTSALARCPAAVWVVSNEVGLSIVPENALARRYRDELGRLHQMLARAADKAVLVVAGLPLTLKS